MADQTPPPADPETTSPTPPSDPAAAGALPSKDDRTMGMLAHLVALAGFVVPLGNVLGPLILWLIRKDTSEFVDDQGKESINFQITVTIAAAISAALITVCIGLVLLPLVGLLMLVFVIIASMKANAGERYRYPLTIRFIK